jgi:outer membrane protein assembly factor BamB
MRTWTFAFLLGLLSFTVVRAENWPQWRGPDGKGISQERGLPESWGSTENIAWKAKIRGLGASSPIVWNDRVFVTSQVGYGPLTNAPHPPLVGVPARPDQERDLSQRVPEELPLGGQLFRQSGTLSFVVAAFDRSSGRSLWEYEFKAEGRTDENKNVWIPAVHEHHNLASPSPVTDGEYVYAWLGTGQIVALDMNGKVAWQRHLGKEVAPYDVIWGHGSSPVLYGDTLILLCDHEAVAYLLALDKRTGAQRWKVDRAKGLRSYSTPAVVPGPRGDELIVSSSERVDAYDAKTGEWLWHTGQANQFPVPFPTHHDGTTFFASGPHRNGAYMAVRLGGRGDITNTHVTWRIPTGAPHVSSLLYYDGLIYLAHENGIATCVDAKTGQRMWQSRMGGIFTASPVAGDGKVYLVSQTGETIVLRAGPKLEIVARNQLMERLMASPAISGGQIFFRTDEHLVAIQATNQGSSTAGAK